MKRWQLIKCSKLCCSKTTIRLRSNSSSNKSWSSKICSWSTRSPSKKKRESHKTWPRPGTKAKGIIRWCIINSSRSMIRALTKRALTRLMKMESTIRSSCKTVNKSLMRKKIKNWWRKVKRSQRRWSKTWLKSNWSNFCRTQTPWLLASKRN